MRLPVAKVYRAFPELDRFSDASCRTFVSAAERSAGPLVMLGVWLCAVVSGFLVALVVFGMLALAYDETRKYGSMQARIPEWIVFGCSTTIPPLLGGVAGFKVRDWWLRAAIRRQIVEAKCANCRYPLIGLRPVDGVVTCPECGEQRELATIGSAVAALMRE